MSGPAGARQAAAQLIRYGIVGVLNNLLGYLIYLGVTWLWLEPKLAVTLLYPVGALTGYFGHARYAFSYQGSARYGLLRYVVAHLVGYGVNVLLLWVFSDRLGFPHQLVQAGAIVTVAAVLFVLLKFFVFPRSQPPRSNAC